MSDHIVETPWDSKVFGMNTYEIELVSKEILEHVLTIPGHFTVKVDALSSKKLLHDYGFYYCDTLIEPFCTPDRFVYHERKGVSIIHDPNLGEEINMSDYAFFHGRFHRDFNIDTQKADLRYAQWLQQLCNEGEVFGLMVNNRLAGFLGVSQNKLILHAIRRKYRGKGLAKFFWSGACKELFARGYSELLSSISAANSPALNLYCSLGFRFRNGLDVYHRLVT